MDNPKWVNQYQAWRDKTDRVFGTRDDNNQTYVISTEFFRANGDNIELYVYPTANHQLRLEDAALTLDEVASAGHSQPSKNQTVQTIVARAGVHIGPDDELYLDVDSEIAAVMDAKQKLLQAILTLNNTFAV
jgi:hypothetical protein